MEIAKVPTDIHAAIHRGQARSYGAFGTFGCGSGLARDRNGTLVNSVSLSVLTPPFVKGGKGGFLLFISQHHFESYTTFEVEGLTGYAAIAIP